jgi:hypothetical protein
MQLPRGTFRYIKKDMKLEGILDELQLGKFSGICTISSGSAQGTLVFKSGKRILAEFRHVTGDAAWDEFQKIAGEKVDASVSTMDDTQIELSLEFNNSCRIGKGGKLEPSSLSSAKTDHAIIKKSPPASPKDTFAAPPKSLQKPHIQEKPALRPSITFETLNIPDTPKISENTSPPHVDHKPAVTVSQQSPEQDSGEKKRLEDEARRLADIESKSFESDIDAIETMDVDIITSKIRGECKTLIKQLRLEHLSEHRKEME